MLLIFAFFINYDFSMLDFIYDSLDTVKSLKHPDRKMYISLTAAIFWVVIITGVYFIAADWIFSQWYQVFYQSMTWTL